MIHELKISQTPLLVKEEGELKQILDVTLRTNTNTTELALKVLTSVHSLVIPVGRMAPGGKSREYHASHSSPTRG